MAAAKLTAVLGNCKRVGRWKIRSTTKALVVFGNCSIDYTEAYADEDLEEIKLDVLCLFGRAVFTLPPGASVQPSSVNMLSSSRFDVEQTDAPSNLPVIKMQSTTVFGVCRVQTASEDLLEMDAPSTHELPEDLEPPADMALTPPPLHLPAESLGAVSSMPEATLAKTPATAERSVAGITPPHSRLDALDQTKALPIDDDTETVHIAA